MSLFSLISSVFSGAKPSPKSSRSTIEDPNKSINDPDVWASLAGDGSESGEKVTSDKALSIAAVWQAINMITGDIAKLPLDLYKRKDDNDRTKERDHVAHRLVNSRPNDEMSAVFFWQTVMFHKLLWGNAFIYIEKDKAGRPISLLPLLPDRTWAKRKNKILYYETQINGRISEPIPPSHIIHLRGISIDGVMGCKTLRYARDTIGLALASRGFASKFFKNGGRKGGILELPANLKKTSADKIEEGFRKHYEGGDASFKTVILRDNAKFHDAQSSPSESQMTESREYDVRDVSRFFNLAPSRLGITDSTSYNSKSEDNQAYLDSTLSIHLEHNTQELELKLLTPAEQEKGDLYFEYNTRALTKMDALKRHQIYALGVRTGIYSPNDCRAFENLNKREGGDEYILQTNLVNSIGNTGSADNIGLGAGEGEGKRSLEVNRFMFALARTARHKSEKPHAFRQWLEGGLISFRDEGIESGLAEGEFDSIFEQLKEIYNKTPPSDLRTAVDKAVTYWEQLAYRRKELDI